MEHGSTSAYLLLGSNMGDRIANIEMALELLGNKCGEVVQRSALYETAAWGNIEQPSFYNLAARLDTEFPALKVIEIILEIEIQIGRVRAEKWGPRLIDIDIIFFGNEIITETDKLIVPHPEMQNRKFVLLPLAEIAGNLIHPVLNKKVIELLSENMDLLPVNKL